MVHPPAGGHGVDGRWLRLKGDGGTIGAEILTQDGHNGASEQVAILRVRVYVCGAPRDAVHNGHVVKRYCVWRVEGVERRVDGDSKVQPTDIACRVELEEGRRGVVAR